MYEQIIDYLEDSKNDPDVIFISEEIREEISKNSNYVNASSGTIIAENYGLIAGRQIFVRPDIDGMIMLDSKLDGWPKPADYK